MSDDEQQSDEFEGFVNELLTNTGSHVHEQVLDESIEEASSVHEELEGVANALKSLSPADSKDFNWEFRAITDANLANLDFGYASTQESDSVKRDSLVSRQIQFFSQNSNEPPRHQVPSMVPPVTNSGSASGKAPSAKPLVAPETQQLFDDIEDNIDLALDTLKAKSVEKVKAMTEGEEGAKLANAKAYLSRLNKLQNKFDEYDEVFRRKCLAIDRAKRSEVREKMVEYEELLSDLKSIAYQAGADAGAGAGAQPQAHQKVTKITPCTLPKFGGNHAKYKAFKKSWKKLCDAAKIEPEMVGFRLHESLEGEAREFVGQDNVWLGRADELWRKLDGRYGNRWTMTSEILKASVLSQPPKEFNHIKKWVDDQLDSIQRVLQLELTPEQLIVNCILVKLPEYIAAPVRMNLKVSGAGGGEFKHSAREFEDAINDTIQTWTPTTPELTQSLTVNHTSVDQWANTQQGAVSMDGVKKKVRFFNRGDVRSAGGSAKCKLCNGDHLTKFCLTYKGVLAKRERLKALGKCPDCSWEQHDGQSCQLKYACNNCTGGSYHLDYLCSSIVPTGS